MIALVLEILVKSSLLVAGAAGLDLCLRRRGSAATRHLVWTLTVVALALLPAFVWSMPQWTVRLPVEQSRTAVARFVSGPTAERADTLGRTASGHERVLDVRSAPDGFDGVGSHVPAQGARKTTPEPMTSAAWLIAPIVIYALGVAALLFRLLTQRWTVRRIEQTSVEVRDASWMRMLADCADRIGVRRPVRLLRGRDQTIPMAIGMRRASVVLPPVCDSWDDERRRAVLLHELAHVARHDCLTQTCAAATCAIYWFHPGVWWAARRMRAEREIACDDRVVSSGTHATDYADHLLELAYAAVGGQAPGLAVTMARSGEIETRLRALLDSARNRTTPAFRTRLAVAVAAASVLAIVAGARATFVPVSAQGSSASTSDVAAPSDRVTTQAGDRGVRVDRAAQAIADGQPGTWEIRSSGNGTVDVRLSERPGSSRSFSTTTTRLSGASLSLASGSTVVKWTLHQDAGTLVLEGIARSGNAPGTIVGAGTFTFEPSPSFPSELAMRGFGMPTRLEQYLLARSDVGFGFIDELSVQGYHRPDLTELVRAADHGVGLSYLREMGQLGYHLGQIEALVKQVDHGVSPEFIRDLRTRGLTKLSADDLVRARDHGVDPEYIDALTSLGYAPLALDALVRARDHGVDPAYVRAMRQQGYQLTLDELITARDHGVDDSYVTKMATLGYATLSLEQLVGARDHGVDADYVGALRTLGYQLSLPDLIAARDHGVDSQYVQELVKMGYNDLPLEQLIRLRDHGVDPNYIRELESLGYTNQSPDDLVRLRDRGVSRNRLKVLLRYQFDRVLASVNAWLAQL